MSQTKRLPDCSFRAFTLVELLVVIGIIALLIAILLPSLAAARRAAKTTQCAANIHQICAAMIGYASDNNGKFPPNGSSFLPYNLPSYWYEQDRVGGWLNVKQNPDQNPVGATNPGGGVFICPGEPTAWRCYSMNIWLSSAVSSNALSAKLKRSQWTPRPLWTAATVDTARTILVSESWTSTGSDTSGWVAPPTIGARSDSAGLLFGAGGGLTPFPAGPWLKVNCELTYYRHRSGSGGTEPIGKVNIGYADGHVETRSNDSLASPQTGVSLLDTLWSPLDPMYP